MDWLLRAALAHVAAAAMLRLNDGDGATFSGGERNGQPIRGRFTAVGAQRRCCSIPILKTRRSLHGRHLVIESRRDRGLRRPGEEQTRGRLVRPDTTAGHGSVARRIEQVKLRTRSRRNVAIIRPDGRLYCAVLDRTRRTAAAYFETPQASIETPDVPRSGVSRPSFAAGDHRVIDIGAASRACASYNGGIMGAQVTASRL